MLRNAGKLYRLFIYSSLSLKMSLSLIHNSLLLCLFTMRILALSLQICFYILISSYYYLLCHKTIIMHSDNNSCYCFSLTNRNVLILNSLTQITCDVYFSSSFDNKTPIRRCNSHSSSCSGSSLNNPIITIFNRTSLPLIKTYHIIISNIYDSCYSHPCSTIPIWYIHTLYMPV